jgi:hypothetical protein
VILSRKHKAMDGNDAPRRIELLCSNAKLAVDIQWSMRDKKLIINGTYNPTPWLL